MVRQDVQRRALRRLDALDKATVLGDLKVPGFDFHPLRGAPKRYSLHVNGPWCITFEWIDGDAWRVDFELAQERSGVLGAAGAIARPVPRSVGRLRERACHRLGKAPGRGPSQGTTVGATSVRGLRRA